MTIIICKDSIKNDLLNLKLFFHRNKLKISALHKNKNIFQQPKEHNYACHWLSPWHITWSPKQTPNSFELGLLVYV